MRKYIAATTSILMVLATISARADDVSGTISADGSGHAVAAPDTAYIRVSVHAKAASPQLALDRGAAIVGTITTGLSGLSIQERDVQTDGLNLQPNYEPTNCDRGYGGEDKPCVLNGFAVDTSLTIRVRDLKNLAPTLTLLGTSEIERINSVSLGVADAQRYRDAAYTDALLDAKRVAQLTATTLGVGLGEISAVSQSSYANPGEPAMLSDGVVYYQNDGGMADLGVLVARGELTFNASVDTTWAIAGLE